MYIHICAHYYNLLYKHPKVICVCVMYRFKRNQLKIIDDHLNTRVLSISLISQHVISMSLYPISKGSCNSIILQTSKVICVVFSTYRKFFFLKISDYPVSLLSCFILIFLVIILTN